MGIHTIQKVVAVADAVDRIEWYARFSTDLYGLRSRQIFALHWDGIVGFYRNAESIQTSSPGRRITLPVRWKNREQSARIYAPGEQLFEFEMELPGDALDRIERFRSGGRLFARLEGSLYVLLSNDASANNPEAWFEDMFLLFSSHNRSMCSKIISEPLEMTRDVWFQDVLGVLRSPNRCVIEVAVPVGTSDEEAATRALAHLNAARQAFDQGRYEEVGRLCYPALEELNKLGDRVEARYGKFGKSRISEQNKEIRALCNSTRHAEKAESDKLAFDRTLAQHVLVMTSSLVGVVLA